MAAYIIARVKVTDPEQYKKYTALTPAAIAGFGGRFVVRGGAVKVLEGPPEDRRIVVIEFPDLEQAQAFYDSETYRHARSVRAGAAEAELILVPGV
jgi:uncharacterized protein (DUF1330 family)